MHCTCSGVSLKSSDAAAHNAVVRCGGLAVSNFVRPAPLPCTAINYLVVAQ